MHLKHIFFRSLAIFLTQTISTIAFASTLPGPVTALARYPTVHGNTVVFEAGGSLWSVALSGGVASRLTDDSGFDSNAVLSPNGKMLAFTGAYRGSTNVYVMSSSGGPVRELTWRSMNYPTKKGAATGTDNIVVGWTPDSKNVVFLSRRFSFNYQIMRAFEVPATGGLPVPLPMPWSGPLSFNRAGTQIIYNKLARPLRDFRRKDYKGGQADKLFTYDLKTGKSRLITHWKGENAWPMWVKNTVYFASDRGPLHVLNLWAKNLSTGQTQQLTHFKKYDIDWPSCDGTTIVLSDGGRLYAYSLITKELKPIKVSVPLDGGKTLPYLYDASKDIRSVSFAPNGRAAVFSARGALFMLPVGNGYTRNLGHKIASNYKDPSWSPDGLSIAYIDDTGAKSQVIVREEAKYGEVKAFTKNSNVTYSGPLVWSPDSNYLTYTDSNTQLWLLNLDSGKSTKIATNPRVVVDPFPDVTFSPDSRWLAFSATLANFRRALFIYDIKTGKLHQISRGRFNDDNPVFSRNGKYLFFTSSRLVNPVASSFGISTASTDSDGLYVLTLQAKTPSLFAPRSTWGPSTLSALSACEKASKKPAPLAKEVTIDFKGLIDRAVRVPVAAAEISEIAQAGGLLYYETTPIPVLGGKLPGQTAKLHAYCLRGRKDKVLVSHLDGRFYLSANGLRLFYPKDGNWYIHYANFKTNGLFKPLSVWKMRLEVHPQAERSEVFWEAWRDVRDYFVNPLLIKARWRQLGEKYSRLLPLAQDPQDLDYIIANMLGSLGESHMYIYGGSSPGAEKEQATAALGMQLALDRKSDYYYIQRIYHGDNTLPGYYAPLAQPGLKIKKGDYVAAINGFTITGAVNPYQYLVGSIGQDVDLTLGSGPRSKVWQVIVKPVVNSEKLRLLSWIRHNREEVSRLSHGKIGYVYLNDMESEGLREFTRQFYRQLNKPAIIIDERWNLGGYVNSVIFNELLQKSVSDFVFRTGADRQGPQSAYLGHLALLVNHGTASDGDIFAYRFKRYHLGPVIGSTTWGGVRGYFYPFHLLDGGHEIISQEAMYHDSRWVVEGVGVHPNIEVHLQPGPYAKTGFDNQLAKAVHVLLKELKNKPVALPPAPPWLPAFPPARGAGTP